jgi:hypothetical protein
MPFVIAHAGHWLVNLLYIVPIVIFAAVFVVQKLKERRAAEANDRAANSTTAKPSAADAEPAAATRKTAPTPKSKSKSQPRKRQKRR